MTPGHENCSWIQAEKKAKMRDRLRMENGGYLTIDNIVDTMTIRKKNAFHYYILWTLGFVDRVPYYITERLATFDFEEMRALFKVAKMLEPLSMKGKRRYECRRICPNLIRN